MKALKKKSKSKVLSGAPSLEPKKKVKAKAEEPKFKKKKAAPTPEPAPVAAEQPVKRGPGRPRTRPLPDPNAPKRPRGRPRTKPLPTPEELKAKEKRRKQRERNRLKKEMAEGNYAPSQLSPGTGKKVIGAQAFSVSSEMLTLTEPKTKPRRGKKNTVLAKYEDAMTTIQQEFGELKRMYGSDAEDFQNDKSTLAMLRASLAMTMDMLPIAEAAYRKVPNNFNANALVNITNQARELANDIRNLQSLEQQVDHINNEVIRPSIRMMAQDLISLTHMLKKEASFYIKKPSARRIMHSHIDAMAQNHGKYMTQTALDMQEKVRKYLTE